MMMMMYACKYVGFEVLTRVVMKRAIYIYILIAVFSSCPLEGRIRNLLLKIDQSDYE
jgi:hypothetical protein